METTFFVLIQISRDSCDVKMESTKTICKRCTAKSLVLQSEEMLALNAEEKKERAREIVESRILTQVRFK